MYFTYGYANKYINLKLISREYITFLLLYTWKMKNKQKISKRKLSNTKIKNNVTEEEENSTKSIFKEESVMFL